MQLQNITIGADPELFLESKSGKGFVSAHGKFPGTKADPFKVKKGAVQVDGTALEFNIHPASTVEEFLENVTAVTRVLQLMVGRADPDLRLVVQPTVVYDQAYFDSLSDEAKALGCEPDFNAYTGETNAPPETKEAFRTGSGHLHIGWTELQEPLDPTHFYDCQAVIRQLDASLYIPSLLWDNDSKRRSLYGKVGAFRPKSYGAEYRPLSNAWVSDPDLQEYVYKNARHAMTLLNEGEFLYSNGYIEGYIQAIRGYEDSLTQPEILKYNQNLIEEFGFPEVPKEYLNG